MDEREPMSEEEADLIATAWELRLLEEKRGTGELWFGTGFDRVPAAHNLCERGWLLRRVSPDLVWRLSDKGLTTLRIDAATSGLSMN
jgi:hypothetical protein